jgi:hypothetical protein
LKIFYNFASNLKRRKKLVAKWYNDRSKRVIANAQAGATR